MEKIKQFGLVKAFVFVAIIVGTLATGLLVGIQGQKVVTTTATIGQTTITNNKGTTVTLTSVSGSTVTALSTLTTTKLGQKKSD